MLPRANNLSSALPSNLRKLFSCHIHDMRHLTSLGRISKATDAPSSDAALDAPQDAPSDVVTNGPHNAPTASVPTDSMPPVSATSTTQDGLSSKRHGNDRKNRNKQKWSDGNVEERKKRPLNAYMLYYQEMVKDDHFKSLKVTEVAQEISQLWKELGILEKQKFQDLAARAMAAYKAAAE